jgi:hypothetical protein
MAAVHGREAFFSYAEELVGEPRDGLERAL